MKNGIGKVLPALVAGLISMGGPAVAAGYRVVDLTPANALEAGGAAADGRLQAGDITVNYYRAKCGPRAYCRVHQTHASLWSGTSASFVDLNPQGYFTSTITGLGATLQVGYGLVTQPVYSGQEHALMWSGSARSIIDLNPSQFRDSNANGTDGVAEVGSGVITGTGTGPHALMWFGSAASVIDLQSAALTSSTAYAVAKGREVGAGFVQNKGSHAYLWAGSAASGVDLNPSGYDASSMLALDGNVEVGWAVPAGQNYHAYLWNGASNKGVDLNPPNCNDSRAQGVRGGTQVGFGSFYKTPNLYSHALAWSGTASSYVDLHRYLPGSYNQSFAYAIAQNGTISGVALDNNFKGHAILWVPM